MYIPVNMHIYLTTCIVPALIYMQEYMTAQFTNSEFDPKYKFHLICLISTRQSSEIQISCHKLKDFLTINKQKRFLMDISIKITIDKKYDE